MTFMAGGGLGGEARFQRPGGAFCGYITALPAVQGCL